MDLAQFSVGTTSPEEVLGKLKATRSTDRDVLLAAKNEYAAPFRQQRFSGLIFLVVGIASSFTLVLAIIGIPVAIYGWWIWRRGVSNLEIVERTYTQFTGTLVPA